MQITQRSVFLKFETTSFNQGSYRETLKNQSLLADQHIFTIVGPVLQFSSVGSGWSFVQKSLLEMGYSCYQLYPVFKCELLKDRYF